jgi:hypothetical protein
MDMYQSHMYFVIQQHKRNSLGLITSTSHSDSRYFCSLAEC